MAAIPTAGCRRGCRLERGRASVPGSDQGLTVGLRERRAPPSEKARQRRAFFWVVLPASLLTSSGDTDTPVKQQARRAHHVSVRCSSDRTSVVSGKRLSVRVDLGGRRIIKKKKKSNKT